MRLPPYRQFPLISNDKITLRQILTSDLEDLLEISVYDGIKATTLLEAAEMQTKINQDYTDGNSIHWGITDNLTHKILGTCGYYRGLDKGSGELGCVLLSQFRGQGYMTAALSLAIDFGLHHIGLTRISAITTQPNRKAITLLERLGFEKISELDDNKIEFELRQPG
jgi:ribosomal-protein-alanine N-acetyltransferase